MTRIRKAIFPVAGLGTRFLPATKAMPKEMLPVVDRPLIQHVVDEARQAGIEHFIFVTGRNKSVIEDHFDRQFELELTLMERGKKTELALLSEDLPEAGTVSFTRQQSPLGLGHAVWCARELVGHEPFALLLPDVLVQHSRGCLAQMIDAAQNLDGNANILAVEKVPKERVHMYGVVGVGERKGKAFAITKMVEKPKASEAPSDLTITGRYILQPQIFELSGKAGRRRGRRDPAHRRHACAIALAAVLRSGIRGPQLRLRLEDRLPCGQRCLWAGARRYCAGTAHRIAATARRRMIRAC